MLFLLVANLLTFNLAASVFCSGPCKVFITSNNIQPVIFPNQVGSVLTAPLYLINAKIIRRDVTDYKEREEGVTNGQVGGNKNTYLKNKAKEKKLEERTLKK